MPLTPEERRFKILSRQIGEAIHSLVEVLGSIQKQITVIAVKQESNHKQEAPQEPQPIQLNPQLEQAVAEYYETGKHRHERTDWWKWGNLILAILSLGLLGWYACTTYRQWRTASAQTEQIGNQVAIMQKQLEATDRPWIEIIRALPNQDGIFKEGTLNFGLTLFIKNVGKSAAMQIGEKAKAITAKNGDDYFNTSLREQQAKCSEKDSATLPLTLFPDQSSSDAWWEALQSGFNVDVATGKFLAPDKKTELIHPLVVGCVDYRIPAGSHHQTYFIYDLGLFRVGHDVPMSKLKVEAFHFGGFDVN